MKKIREITLDSGTKLLLGKDREGNDQLMAKYKGKTNTILHTSAPGSPFCVLEMQKANDVEVYAAGVVTARYSQDWRDNKSNVKVDVFSGKDVYKLKGMPVGTWGVKKKKTITIKKSDILKLIG